MIEFPWKNILFAKVPWKIVAALGKVFTIDNLRKQGEKWLWTNVECVWIAVR